MDYHFQLAPQTILIDRPGKVEKVWTGILNDSAMAELTQLTGGSKAASQTSDINPGFSLH